MDLAVFDVQGRRVTTIASGVMDAGRYELIWNGTDDRGAEVSSGVYFYEVKTAGQAKINKMALVK